MIEDDIVIRAIVGVLDAGRRTLGDDAIKVANELTGLHVRGNGEIVVSGDALKTLGNLCRALEKSMRGRIVIDIEVRLNLHNQNTE